MVIAGAFLLLLALPFYLLGLKWWCWFWIALGLVLGIFELVARNKRELTLSQMFWFWSLSNKGKKWILFTTLILFWIVLMVHLFFKIG
jgi:hypothetical protein